MPIPERSAGVAASGQTVLPPQPPHGQAIEPMQPPSDLPRPQRGDPVRNLDFLFEALKAAPDADTAKQVENRIWALWLASGSDTANLGGNAGVDTFVGRPTVSSLTGTGYQYTASGFDTVAAFAGAGGVDRGILFDSAGNDIFRGFNNLGQISGPASIYRAFDFDILTIHGTAGGLNRLLVDANIQYQLNQVGSWV